MVFNSTTFHVQIHNLPPIFLHEGTVEGIGRLVGEIHKESIRRCVIGHRYIRIRVDIALDALIPASFFQNREDGEDAWVQFKYERLSDFCYKCGALGHVTSRCHLETPATISSGNGITTKLYGPWLRAEHGGSLLFINPTPVTDDLLLSD